MASRFHDSGDVDFNFADAVRVMAFADLPWYDMVAQTIDALYVEELNRHSDIVGAASWLFHAREEGKDVEWMRAQIRQSPEWHAIHDHPQPMPRPPLPPFPSGSFDHVLPWSPPVARDFLRADAWSVTLPGLPFVPGGSSRHPERCLSWFLDRWDASWQGRILDSHRARAYTHFVLSWPDSRSGNGQSLAQFAETCQRVKDAGLYPVVFLGSKVYDAKDRQAAIANATIDPVMDTINGIAAEYIPCWEMDLWNVPGMPTLDHCRHVGQRAHAQGASCWLHFSSEKTSWFADGDPRGRYGFWSDLGGDVDGLCYQTVPTWNVPDLQARLVDTLAQFGKQGNQHKLRLFEDQASLMFDGDRPNEDDANLRGYLACCTVDNVAHTDAKVWGFGGGARMPDGSPL